MAYGFQLLQGQPQLQKGALPRPDPSQDIPPGGRMILSSTAHIKFFAGLAEALSDVHDDLT